MADKQQKMEVAKKPIDLFKLTIKASDVQKSFQEVLGDRKEAFTSSLIDLATDDKSLQSCNPSLVAKEALRAATMDLPLNKALGYAYIVVFRKCVKIKNADGTERTEYVPTPTFMLGYKGYIQLAIRSKQYKTINEGVVYEGELVQEDKMTGRIDLSGKRKSNKVIGYFAYIELNSGFSKTLYMSVEDMAKYAKRFSKSVNSKTTVAQLEVLANKQTTGLGWEGDFNSMGRKTVLRRLLSKYGYLSLDMQRAIAADEASDESSRDEMIAAGANSQNISTETVSYQDVSTMPIQQQDAPNY